MLCEHQCCLLKVVVPSSQEPQQSVTICSEFAGQRSVNLALHLFDVLVRDSMGLQTCVQHSYPDRHAEIQIQGIEGSCTDFEIN